MAAPAPTISPISHANDWQYFTIGGVNSPGSIPPDGIKGFKRETGWDVKKGKGTVGATLTLNGRPPCKGTIELDLITSADFAGYDNLIAQVLAVDAKAQQQTGFGIYHPAFTSIGLTQVVVAYYTPPLPSGTKRKYRVTIEFIEWQPPPPVSAVSTPASAAPDGSSKGPKPPSPERLAKQQQIKVLQYQLKAAGR